MVRLLVPYRGVPSPSPTASTQLSSSSLSRKTKGPDISSKISVLTLRMFLVLYPSGALIMALICSAIVSTATSITAVTAFCTTIITRL